MKLVDISERAGAETASTLSKDIINLIKSATPNNDKFMRYVTGLNFDFKVITSVINDTNRTAREITTARFRNEFSTEKLKEIKKTITELLPTN